MKPLAFSLDCGVVTLDCSLSGELRDEHQRFVEWQVREFVGGPPLAHRVDCDFLFEGDAAVETVGAPQAAPQAFACGSGIYAEWPFYRGYFDENVARASVTSLPVGLDHAIRAAAIFATLPTRALWFHGATLRCGDRAVLLVGPSGAGKSTISREGHADVVLCDEISVLSRDDAGWWAHPSPFWGTLGYATRASGPARLDAVAVLSHGGPDGNRWTPIRGAAALAALMPHVGAQAPQQLAHPLLLPALTALLRDLPLYSLAWTRGRPALDGAPWSHSR